MSKKLIIAMVFISVSVTVALLLMADSGKWITGVPNLVFAVGIACGYLLGASDTREAQS